MEVIRMSPKERRRLELLSRVRDAGLVHRLRGRPSPRRKPDRQRSAILALYRAHYADPPRRASFGPTLAAEKLAQRDGHHLDHETLRHWLIADGQWQRRRRRPRHRQRRERQPHVGALVQVDGSEHD